MQSNLTRNSNFFNDEFEKLDKWAEDMKLSLEKEIKELEKKRNEKRKKLFESQDLIDNRKDSLLNEIEARLKQKTSQELLFQIRWELV
jgi:hypothetical protein